MYRVDILSDPKEMTATEARRNRERNRQSRFFSVWKRAMGVDVEALNCQVEERKHQEAMEPRKDMVYGAKNVRYDPVAPMVEKKEADQTYQFPKRAQDLLQQQQHRLFNNQPESNLWNPGKFQEFPTPLSNSGLCNGPSRRQCFLGKDQNRASHMTVQKEHLPSNLEKQLQEQKEIIEEEIRADLLSEQLRLAADTRAAELARLEESCRAALRTAMANANRAQAAKQAQNKHRQRQHRDNVNLTEIKKKLTRELVTENSQAAQHPQASNRVLPYCWKGMTSEQRAAIRKTQEAQRQEKKEQHQAGKELDAEWENQTVKLAEAALELEAQERELGAEFRRGLGSFKQELAKEQQAQHNYLNSIIYTNQSIAPYYRQFNTTSR
uniref:RIB43A-like with coiled-coils protein 1 n=1 Tax=Jaculus jaculus TaxID=51337 RepID=A0A8C5KJW1_JACJA